MFKNVEQHYNVFINEFWHVKLKIVYIIIGIADIIECVEPKNIELELWFQA
jgi:hypothetical protein